MNPTAQAFNSFRTISLQAGVKIPLDVTGRVFVCSKSDGPFFLGYDSGEMFPVKGAGVEWFLPDPAERFTRLYFQSETDQVVEFYAGTVFWHENVVTPILKVAETVCVAGPDSIPASSSVLLDGSAGSGHSYRKLLLITNRDPGSNLELLDETGLVRLATIPFLEAFILETSGTVTLANETGSPIECRVCEVFYKG